jgi:hypothetical protein
VEQNLAKKCAMHHTPYQQMITSSSPLLKVLKSLSHDSPMRIFPTAAPSFKLSLSQHDVNKRKWLKPLQNQAFK